MDPDTYTEYGKNIIRTAVTQPFADQGNSVNVPELEPVFEAGVGNSEVIDPKIRVSFSKDAKTWSDERSKPIGKIGEYMRRSIFYRLGRFPRFALFKVVLSDAVKPV
jgi:hypothetical protein